MEKKGEYETKKRYRADDLEFEIQGSQKAYINQKKKKPAQNNGFKVFDSGEDPFAFLNKKP